MLEEISGMCCVLMEIWLPSLLCKLKYKLPSPVGVTVWPVAEWRTILLDEGWAYWSNKEGQQAVFTTEPVSIIILSSGAIWWIEPEDVLVFYGEVSAAKNCIASTGCGSGARRSDPSSKGSSSVRNLMVSKGMENRSWHLTLYNTDGELDSNQGCS